MTAAPQPSGTDGRSAGGTGFLGAVQFLTRVPVRLRTAPDHAATVPWFPIVGALIGLAVGAVAAALMEAVPSTVAAAVAVIVGLLVTGAFHEDGLADTADALGGWSPEQRREILKDSRHGSYGVAAMCSTIVLRILCVAALGPAAAVAGLVAAHSLGRAGAVAVLGLVRPAPGDGLGADRSRTLGARRTAAGITAGVLVATLATGWWVAPLATAAAAGAGLAAWLAVRAFGGVSGDLLGAAEQAGECLVLVVVTALAAHHTVWWTV